jgi:hypothetical protein
MWEAWSEEDFKFIDNLIGAAQSELAVVSSRALSSEVRERASRVELLLRAASIMTHGDWKNHSVYVKTKVGIAISAYGLEIVIRQDSSEASDDDYD